MTNNQYIITFNDNDELYHYGTMGQKWGVRRFQNEDGTLTAEGKARYKQYKKDWKEVKKDQAHINASKRNMKIAKKGTKLNDRDYYDALKEARKVKNKFYISRTVHSHAINEANEEVEKAASKKKFTDSIYFRAKRIYEDDVKKYVSDVNNIKAKYGEDSIKSPDVKTVMDKRTKEVNTIVKTNLTYTNIPFIGAYLGNRYTSAKEMEYRQKEMEEHSK